MKRISLGMWVILSPVFLLAACDPWPTQEDIERELEEQLRSVVGPWEGHALAGPPLRLRFGLVAAADSLAGSGWQWFADASDSTAITIRGRYRRPDFDLTFAGVKWEGEAGIARFRGEYSSVAGIVDTLQVDTTGHSGQVVMHLFER